MSRGGQNIYVPNTNVYQGNNPNVQPPHHSQSNPRARVVPVSTIHPVPLPQDVPAIALFPGPTDGRATLRRVNTANATVSTPFGDAILPGPTGEVKGFGIHFQHRLTYQHSLSISCTVCGRQSGAGYDCRACCFSLCDECSRKDEVKNQPAASVHFAQFDPHVLVLYQKLDTSCKTCGRGGVSLGYACTSCSTTICLSCSFGLLKSPKEKSGAPAKFITPISSTNPHPHQFQYQPPLPQRPHQNPQYQPQSQQFQPPQTQSQPLPQSHSLQPPFQPQSQPQFQPLPQQPQFQPPPQTQSQPLPQSHSLQPPFQPQSQPQFQSQPQSQSQPLPQFQPQSQPQFQPPQTQSQPLPQFQPPPQQPQFQPPPQTQSQPLPQSHSLQQPQFQPQSQPQFQPQSQTQSQPLPQYQHQQPPFQPQSQPQFQPQPQSQPQFQPQPQSQSQTQPLSQFPTATPPLNNSNIINSIISTSSSNSNNNNGIPPSYNTPINQPGTAPLPPFKLHFRPHSSLIGQVPLAKMQNYLAEEGFQSPAINLTQTTSKKYLRVFVERAQDLRSADITDTGSDTYCVVTVSPPKEQFGEIPERTFDKRTNTIFGTTAPTWNHAFYYDTGNVTDVTVRFEVYDFERIKKPFNLIGGAVISVNLAQVTESNITLPLNDDKIRPGGRVPTLTFNLSLATAPTLKEDDPEQAMADWREIFARVKYFPPVPAPYTRFTYLFYMWDKRDDSNVAPVTTYPILINSKMEKAYMRGEKSFEYFDGKYNWEVDFEVGLQTIKDAGKSSQGGKRPLPRNKYVFVARRLPRWFWRDITGIYTPYDDDTQMTIWIHIINRSPKISGIKIGKHQYEINLEKKTQTNLKSKATKDIFMEDFFSFTNWTPKFEKTSDRQTRLITLDKNDPEYQKVTDTFYLSFPKRGEKDTKPINTICKVQKVINPTLRDNWEHELKVVTEKNKDIVPGTELVRLLFHGTGNTDPKLLYESDKGWKINYVGDANLWGKGIYFASDAVYSGGKYAYTTPEGKKVILLAEVILGDAINSEENKSLIEPPTKKDMVRYDSVIGIRHGTWIFVVYESARAYPTYVIEFDPNA